MLALALASRAGSLREGRAAISSPSCSFPVAQAVVSALDLAPGRRADGAGAEPASALCRTAGAGGADLGRGCPAADHHRLRRARAVRAERRLWCRMAGFRALSPALDLWLAGHSHGACGAQCALCRASLSCRARSRAGRDAAQCGGAAFHLCRAAAPCRLAGPEARDAGLFLLVMLACFTPSPLC